MVMTSRHKQQDARRRQREQGTRYAKALRDARGGSGPGGPDGRDGQTIPEWDPERFSDAQNNVLARIAAFQGDVLPPAAVEPVARFLGLHTFDGDIGVSRVTLGPPPFHDVESSVTATYDYGLEVVEVSVVFTADIEVTVSSDEGTSLISQGRASLLYPDTAWPTVVCPGVQFQMSAQVRLEFEFVEIVEELFTLG